MKSWFILWIAMSAGGDRGYLEGESFNSNGECIRAGMSQRPAMMRSNAPNFISFVCKRREG